MRNSLIFKLMGAFLLVIAVIAVVISLLVGRATQNAFNLYTTRSGQVWAQRLAPILADYYSTNSSWVGVETVLQSGLPSPATAGMMGNGYGPGQGQGLGFGRQAGMWGMMGQRLLLTDERGVVVSDTSAELVGQTLSSTQLKSGAPIFVNGSLVGTILVTPSNFTGTNTPAGLFLTSVKQSIILSVIVASIIALLLGAALFFYITNPLRQLNKAASDIANGDLSRRVVNHSQDELGELSRTFNHMAYSLEQAATQRQHLMADVAHELRTPIAVMQANLEGMLDGVIPIDEEHVAELHDETLLLNRLVGDLRLLSLAEAGELKLESKETDIAGLISQIVERIKVQAQQMRIKLELELQEHLPNPWVDTDRITQVLNNLIGNALRYTPPDGKIILRAERGINSEASIQVSVTDNGPGIDPAELPFVFDRFYRADQSQGNGGGSGLGLAIVKQLVEAHGGTVEAASPIFFDADQVGFGTRISFTLPVRKP